MSDEGQDNQEAQFNLLGISAGWVDGLTEHADAVASLRLSYARSTQDPLEVPKGCDDWGVRLTEVLDDTKTRTLNVFEIGGIGQFPGPQRLAEWLWEEATDHWRGVRTMSESADEVPPKRLRAVLTLLDAKHTIIDELGAYVGIRSRTQAERRARARGVQFAESTDAETGEPAIPASPSRINRELERGYIAQLRLSNETSKAYAKSVGEFADKTMALADRYRDASLEPDDGDDEVALAFLELGKEFLGHARERKGVRDDIGARAPQDGKAGGPACAYARQALEHFTDEVIERCRDLLGGGFNQALAVLRYANESSADEKKFLKRFRQSAEWFIAIAQSDPSKLRAIPVAAREPLQACASLALAG
jgi:hypothetical protein